MTDEQTNPTDRPAEAADGGTGLSNPFDAWLADAPAALDADLCPWCSARLDPPALETCPSCGARLRGAEGGEIPGLTVVDPAAVIRRAPPPKAGGGAGVLAWLSGDSDLVAAAGAEPSPAPGGPGQPSWPGAPDGGREQGAGPAAALGPASQDAVAPPDPRVRLEMLRIAAGMAPGTFEAPSGDDVPAVRGESDEPGSESEEPGSAVEEPPSGAADGPSSPGDRSGG